MVHSARHMSCVRQEKIKRSGADARFQVPEVPIPYRENTEYQRQISANRKYSGKRELVVRTSRCQLIRLCRLRGGRNLRQGAQQNVTRPHLRTAQTLFDWTARRNVDHQVEQQRGPQKKHSTATQIGVQQRASNNRRIEQHPDHEQSGTDNKPKKSPIKKPLWRPGALRTIRLWLRYCGCGCVAFGLSTHPNHGRDALVFRIAKGFLSPFVNHHHSGRERQNQKDIEIPKGPEPMEHQK